MLIQTFKKEPVGATALALTLLVTVLPLTYSFVRDNYFYGYLFNIRCEEVSERKAVLEEGLIVQRTDCVFTNNSGQSNSIVGIIPVTFYDDYAHRMDTYINFYRKLELPIYLEPGQAYKLTTNYVASTTDEVAIGDSGTCEPAVSVRPVDSEIGEIRVCVQHEPRPTRVIEGLFDGSINIERQTTTGAGLIFELGNGRDLEYQAPGDTYSLASSEFGIRYPAKTHAASSAIAQSVTQAVFGPVGFLACLAIVCFLASRSIYLWWQRRKKRS